MVYYTCQMGADFKVRSTDAPTSKYISLEIKSPSSRKIREKWGTLQIRRHPPELLQRIGIGAVPRRRFCELGVEFMRGGGNPYFALAQDFFCGQLAAIELLVGAAVGALS